jgi:predicted transcriptional regulator
MTDDKRKQAEEFVSYFTELKDVLRNFGNMHQLDEDLFLKLLLTASGALMGTLSSLCNSNDSELENALSKAESLLREATMIHRKIRNEPSDERASGLIH